MKTNKFKSLFAITVILALTVLSLVSCNAGGDGFGDAEGEYSGTTGDGGFGMGELLPDTGNTQVAFGERKLIKTVHETVETESYDSFIDSLSGVIAEAGGYIEASSYRGSEYSRRNASITIRIPQESLDSLTDHLKETASVTYYSEKLDDVTVAYIDIESKIDVLLAEETALLEMLSSATTVEQILQIRENLTEVQSQLASLKNQKKHYDSLIAYSTVNLTVYEVKKEVKTDKSFGEEVSDGFSESFEEFTEGLRDFGVWFLSNIIQILFTLAIVVGAIFIIVLIIKKLRNRLI